MWYTFVALILIPLIVPTYGQNRKSSCVQLCGFTAHQCIKDCEMRNQTAAPNSSLPIELMYITTFDTATEITGSDMHNRSKIGKLFFTTRDGAVYRFIPNPFPGNPTTQKMFDMKENFDLFRLDTRNDKGLYDIAFLRNFTSRRVYLLYASYLAPSGYDHSLKVAEFILRHDETFQFVKIIESVPQKMTTRSGGFMKSEHSLRESPLWISSGGNQWHDPDLLKSQPKYSSIYGMNVEHAPRQNDFPYLMWANGLSNPYECDYSPLFHPNDIVCLTKQYDNNGEVNAVSLFRAEAGHTFDEETSTVIQTNGYRTTTKMHSYTQIFDPEIECVPETVIYSGNNLLGYGYQGKIIVGRPTCMQEGFQSARLQILVRNSRLRRWELADMPIDFGIYGGMWNLQLMGAERSRGMFLAGRDIETGKYNIFFIRKKPEQ